MKIQINVDSTKYVIVMIFLNRFCYKQKLSTRLITKRRNTDFIIMQKERRGSSGIFSQRHAEAAD